MGSVQVAEEKRRAGAEVVHGAAECYQHSLKMLEELGFPKGVLPLRNLEECGWVQATGFVWMKQREPYEHFFKGTNTRVRYDREVTAYVERRRMKRMTGVRSKQVMLWVPISEMSMVEPVGEKIYFKSAVGIGRAFPVSAFVDDDEEEEEEEVKKKADEENVKGGDDQKAVEAL